MPVPGLSVIEEMAYSTVRILTEYPSGNFGTGTGFFFRFRENGDSHIPVIVTNKHVVAGATHGSFRLTLSDQKGNPTPGDHEDFRLDSFERRWVFHPDDKVDLCVMPVGPLFNTARDQGKTFFYRSFGRADVATANVLTDLLGMDAVTMIGYPNGIWDEVNNYPVFRRGVTATHPKNDWNGDPVFLVDLACFPGSSGSPVLLTDFGMVVPRTGGVKMGGTRIKLLGILYAGPQYTASGDIQIVDVPVVNKPVVKTMIPNNLGIVVKAAKLLEIEISFPDSK